MVAKFWIKQLLIKPDPSPYLLANKMPAVRLYAAPNEPLYWTNPERVIADTLSGNTLGQSPFELRFDVHSKAVTDGTTKLFDAPGLIECIAQDETLYFKFAWELPWYSLDKKYLKSGWNSVALVSDGEKIYLQVNEYVSTLVDSSIAITKSILYSGFTSSRYISLKQPFGTYQSYEITIPVLVANNTNTQPIVAKSNADVTMYLQGSSSCLRVYPGETVLASNVMSGGKFYWTKLVYNGSNHTAYIAADDHSKNAQDLPAVSDNSFWTAQAQSSSINFSGDTWHIGHNGSTNKYWESQIDIGRSLIITDGEVFADGTIEGSFSSKFDFNSSLARVEKEYKPPYPKISVGQISSPVSWTKVRNIKAVIL